MPASLNTSPTTDSPSRSLVALENARLNIDPVSYHASYNRTPFGFTHNLHQLDIFQFDSILELLERYNGASNDYYVAGSAAAAGSAFFDAPRIKLTPKQAVQQLEAQPTRILLKRLGAC